MPKSLLLTSRFIVIALSVTWSLSAFWVAKASAATSEAASEVSPDGSARGSTQTSTTVLPPPVSAQNPAVPSLPPPPAGEGSTNSSVRPTEPNLAKLGPSVGQLLNQVQLGAGLDLYGSFPLQNGGPTEDRLVIREAELAFFLPVPSRHIKVYLDFDGHDDDGDFEFWMREAWFGWQIPRDHSEIRVGRFALGVGRLNQFHQADWPFISAPKSHVEFFSPDQAVDEGIEYTYKTVPESTSGESPFALTVGVTNGYCYGHCTDSSGTRPVTPVNYLHPTFFSGNAPSGLLIGATYLGYTDSNTMQNRLVGADLTWKKYHGAVLSWFIQTELYDRYQRPAGLPIDDQQGGYFYAAYGWNETWSTGCRLDGFTDSTLRNEDGTRRPNFQSSIVPTLTYALDPQTKIRGDYMYLVDNTGVGSAGIQQRFELQLIASLGLPNLHGF